jgi:hypothetical protein
VSCPKGIYHTRPDATPESELSALATVYKFVLDSHAKKNPAAGLSGQGDYDGKAKGDSADEPTIRD